jgi:CDP-diacylglycerol--glycerol-3-phosphate 3-phosphatidyltransferase
MIARSVLRCSATRRGLTAGRSRLVQGKARRYSTSSGHTSASSASPAAPLSAFTNELDKIAPRFDIQGSQISILRTPAEFYETLKEKIRKAEDRIFLSTLYIGKTEHELVIEARFCYSNAPLTLL